MSDGDALYEAILADPADDLPRLVYADWLEEHGDTERAEFIRVQIDLARLPATDPRRSILRRREKRLLDEYKSRWSISQLRGGQAFARGFVDEVWASAEEVVGNAPALLRLPMRGLRISAVGEHFDSLAGLPILAKIERLDLSNNAGIHNRFDRLFYNGGSRNLTSLVLRNVRVWGENLSDWPMIPGFSKLTHLDLSGNPVGNEGLSVLAGHPGFGSVVSLVLRGDGQEDYDLIDDEGLSNLAVSRAAGRVTRLDLSANLIRYPGIIALSASNRFVGLKDLNLSENPIAEAGASALARWPLLATIDSIDLRKCNLSALTRANLLASPWASKFLLDEPNANV